MAKNISLYFILVLSLFSSVAFSQEETIDIKTIDFSETVILFEKYEAIGKHCANKNGIAKHCEKEEKLLDNNIEELLFELENTLFYLTIQNELIDKKDLEKAIYDNKNYYRYVFSAIPKMSTKGNSCFSNPGALIFKFYLYDRLEEKKYAIDLKYAFYICDVQILVNSINKNLKEAKKKLK